MSVCDLCGKEVDKLVRAEIEGTELGVCGRCSKFGRILRRVKNDEERKKVLLPRKRLVVEEIEERVVFDCAERIRKAREKKGMKQEEFAKLLSEKESLVQKWEGGSLRPRIETARKLEKILGIGLVERLEEGKVELKATKSGEITLGDVISIRRRKIR